MRYMYCDKCHNLFNEELIAKGNFIRCCPVVSCGSNEIVELDELLARSVQQLNKMGYKTVACCQGHIQEIVDGFCGSYIMFDKWYDKIAYEVANARFGANVEYCPWGDKGESHLHFKDEYVKKALPGVGYGLVVEFSELVTQLVWHRLLLGDASN